MMVIEKRKEKGFTLIEMLIVVALVGLLVTIALPTYRNAIRKAKESVLKQNLWSLRDVLDQYYADKGNYPASLDDLVTAGYYRRLPRDPMTGQSDWVVVPFSSGTDSFDPVATDEAGGIWDVHSASEKVALNGEYYSDW